MPSPTPSTLPPDRALTDEERYPNLSAAGKRMLDRLRNHPHAPLFNHACGDRLDAAGLAHVRAFAADLVAADKRWEWNSPPEWTLRLAERCLRSVPFYRAYGRWSGRFDTLPITQRADLSHEPWSFVPNDAPLDELIVYDTSGTTGHRVVIPSHPHAAAKYLPLLEAALATRGVAIDRGPEHVAMMQVCAQKRTWTFGNVAQYLDEAGFAKINLDPDAWRDPDDRLRYLDDCAPQVYTGDPVAFQELARLPLRRRPRALLSSATALLPGVRRELEERFGCPVIDIYSMKESGPIAVENGAGYEVLPHDLYIEILDPEGRPCPPGTRGEIVVSGGRNPYLPLLRYRTGDWAAMDFSGPLPTLVGIEGRAPVVFRSPSGAPINSIDVTWALRGLPLTQYVLHQAADGSFTFKARSGAPEAGIRTALHGLLGAEATLRMEELPEHETWAGKVLQYSVEE